MRSERARLQATGYLIDRRFIDEDTEHVDLSA